MNQRKILFLDRDGVVNVDTDYLYKIEEFVFVPHIVALCQAAQAYDYRIAIITNQSGIARGMYSHQDVAALHTYMRGAFAQAGVTIDAVYYCPHLTSQSECLCRKPKSLLFERAAAQLRGDFRQSVAVGDKARDLIPVKQHGGKTILYRELASDLTPPHEAIDFCVSSLADVIAHLEP